MTDLILDDDNDLRAAAGDLVAGDDLIQRQKVIAEATKNDFKQFPEMGVDVENYLEDEDPQALFAEIREQYRLDKMTLKSIGIDKEGKIFIDAKDS